MVDFFARFILLVYWSKVPTVFTLFCRFKIPQWVSKGCFLIGPRKSESIHNFLVLWVYLSCLPASTNLPVAVLCWTFTAHRMFRWQRCTLLVNMALSNVDKPDHTYNRGHNPVPDSISPNSGRGWNHDYESTCSCFAFKFIIKPSRFWRICCFYAKHLM